MPIRIEQVDAGGDITPSPFVGPVDHTAPVRVTASNLTTAEVDANGYLRPGVLFRRNGALVTAVVTAGEFVYGAAVESAKIAKSNSAADLTAAGTVTVIVGLHCAINRAVLEDSLGRALTAGEVAAADAAGSSVVLIY